MLDATSNAMAKYSYFLSGSAPKLYPTETFFGNLMWSDDDGISVPYCCPFADEWGKPVSMHVYDDKDFPVPEEIDMIWLSLAENRFYSIEEDLPKEDIEQLLQEKDETTGNPLYNYIIVGMAPYGQVALWLHGDKKAKLLSWMEAEETDVEIAEFCPGTRLTRAKYVQKMLESVNEAFENLQQKGLPPHDLFDNYMKQFTYRYLPLFEHWDEDEEKWQPYTEEEQETKPELDYIEEALYDGTHDKLHDGGLLNYHDAGKPKKLAVKWHIKKSEYTAYFWFEDEAIRTVFDKFYGIHPDTKTDFVIHIDPEKKKYELALYRYGMNEPKPISEDAYQLIVFKNKFEHFRSNNYDQPRGAWIW